MGLSIEELSSEVDRRSIFIRKIRAQMSQVMVGQQYMSDRLLVGLLAGGHILLEGMPGLAKTTAVKTLATSIATTFHRIQFTPDLLPADLIGTQIYNPAQGVFSIKKGPIFTHLLLADEINRAPAKVQSALLEAMQEKQVTIGDETFILSEPFLVLATQNPIEQEGTYPLPEAQIDRFMLKLKVGYPNKQEEKEIVLRAVSGFPEITPVVTVDEILSARELVREIHIDDRLINYIVDIVFATRESKQYQLDLSSLIQVGASPRSTISLMFASKALAFLNGRGYVTPHDIKSIAPDVLRHRIILTYEAEAEELTTDDVIERILNNVEVP